MSSGIIAETRLVCPCCNQGFISLSGEKDVELIGRYLTMPTNYPRCNNCSKQFVINIDRTLKITFQTIKY